MIKVTTPEYVERVFTADGVWVDRRRSWGLTALSGATATVYDELSFNCRSTMSPWSAFRDYPPPAGRRR